MNLYDIISDGERLVLDAREEERSIYTWNQSLTVQKWVQAPGIPLRNRGGEWDEVDVHTLSEKPTSWEEAQKKIRELWPVER